jgi:hypothetical protein
MFKYCEHMAIVEHRILDVPAFVERAVDRLAEAGLPADWAPTGGDGGRTVFGTVTVAPGGNAMEFSAVACTKVTAADLALLPHDARTVLITEHVSQVRAQQLKERGWGGYADSAGNASLRGKGVFVEITGRRGAPTASATAATAPYTRTGLPVTFALLTADEHFGTTPTQRALADSTGASLGTVNRVLRALRERTPPMLEGRRNELVRPEILEREWISAYSAQQPAAWPDERFTSDTWYKPTDLLEATLPPGALFSSEIAAARLGAPIRPASALIHIDGDRTRRELIRLGRLRKDDNGPIRLRPALWHNPPVPTAEQTVPRLLIRADLLLEDDPRTDEISAEFRGIER